MGVRNHWRRVTFLLLGGGLLLGALVLVSSPVARATPSSVLWTVTTPYVQPFAVPHLTYDSYFNGVAAFPIDVGLTMGLLPFRKVQAEAGCDLFYPGSDPFQLNFKFGVPEDAFGKHVPGLSVGVFGMGFEKDVNDYNIIHFEVGKTVPIVGTVAVGMYRGLNSKLLKSGFGKDQSLGFLVSFYRTLEPWMGKIAVAADYMSGDNVFGGGGAGLYFWFTKYIAVVVGWVWFNDPSLNRPFRDGVFTIQLDVDINLKNEKFSAD